jgi:hypothetical protein
MKRICVMRFAALLSCLAGLLIEATAPADVSAAEPGDAPPANFKPFAGKPLAARYATAVNEELILRWSTLVQENVSMLSASTVRLKFIVDKSGAIRNVRITSATPKAKLAVEIAKKAVGAARLKPFSPALIREVGSAMEFNDFAFTMQ